MSTITTTEIPPYHLPPANHLTENFPISQKTILNFLNTKCSTSMENLEQAHALILKTDHFQDHYVAGTLVKCYANPRLGSLESSIRVLEHVQNPNVFVWNCIIKGCVDNKEFFKAICFYIGMVSVDSRPNKYTYPPLFKACIVKELIAEGMQLHGHIIKHGLNADGHIISSGIRMYASLGRLEDAQNMFDESAQRDVVCCNAMIDGCMKSRDLESARELFDDMKEKNVGSWNTMVSGYANNGQIEEAKKYFDEMPEKDEVSWSAMIDGYSKGRYFKEALEVFNAMQGEEIKPSKFVLSSVLAACANVGALAQGKWIHDYVRRNSIPLDAVLGTSLVDMYAKCGRIDLAWEVFEKMKDKEIFSWNAMIGGLAMHGRAEDAIELFVKMLRQNLKPNDITFTALLNACAHTALVDKGLEYFHSIEQVYELKPTLEHYGCVVDLLGRAGLLTEAVGLINHMPMKPNAVVYGALLSACGIHGNVDLAEKIGETLLELEPENSGRYALLSNIYAKAGKWDNVAKLRKSMKERGMKTIPGSSTINLNGIVHEFKVGDSSHPQINDIHLMLEKIIQKIGHVPDTSQVLFDISEEEKETALSYHSEKLAIAFGILNTAPGTTICIVKNLRACKDCHTAAKLISQVYKREIIVRDRVRFHHFKNGQCSCNDFW
ncbi:pentatricopeptide repeat-containing At5g66520-like [Olea europaea subsp. europaea]|uniref:Pentatricopeptide repeat-containing At5g66520-like n=3 Tax=Olea europaea subsp. europaea TaxID=158383 RepID=A0A8S0RFM4_OLEEU|nr:pentatricopeptide repeat-containing At5g66520-like [Olea europaea subsp. europaea]